MTQKEKLEDLVQDLQERAESENYHDHYEIYEDIADMVERHAGIDAAVKVMQEISDSGGWMN